MEQSSNILSLFFCLFPFSTRQRVPIFVMTPPPSLFSNDTAGIVWDRADSTIFYLFPSFFSTWIKRKKYEKWCKKKYICDLCVGTLFGAQTCVPPSFAPFNCCKIGICYSEAPWSYNTQTFDKCNYLYRTSLYIKAFKWKQNILFPLCNVGPGENRCRPYYPQIRWYSKMSACLSSIVQSLKHNHIEQSQTDQDFGKTDVDDQNIWSI